MRTKGQTTVNIDYGILNKASKLADDECRSFSSLVEIALKRELQRHELMKKYEAQMAKEEVQKHRRPAAKSKR